jgi:integrase
MPVLNLTAQFVKGIRPPPSGRVEYWDEGAPGLCLRVTAGGSASWSFRYRPREGGKRNERVTFGSVDALTLADARDRAAKVRAEVVDGGNPQFTRRQKRQAAKHALTFDRLAERYLTEYAKPRKASWKDDEQRLGRARKALGNKEVATITRRDVINFLDTVKRTAPVQANRTQTIICTMFNWGVEEELLDTNPIAGLKKRSKETAATRTLSDAELRVLWGALDDTKETTVDIADALKALLLTGQRPGVIAGALQRDLVDLKGSSPRLEIPAERMKARRPHVVPLAPMALDIFNRALTRRQEEDEKAGVFSSRYLDRSTLARHSLSQALRRVIASLSVDGPDFEVVRALQEDPPTPHDFRRTVATGMAALSIPREDRPAVLAHLPGDIHGSVYDQYERLRENRIALEGWERHVAGVLGFGATVATNIVPMTKRAEALPS